MPSSLIDEIAALLGEDAPVDFDAYRYRVVPAARHFTARRRQADLHEHLKRLAAEAAQQSALVLLHAALNVALRRQINVAVNAARLRAMWSTHGAFLAEMLSLRWLVSACDSFMDVPDSPQGAALALNGAMAANLIKLAETDRRFLHDSRAVADPGKPHKALLFDGMLGYRPGTDDMLRNLFARADRLSDAPLPEAQVLREILSRLHRADTVVARLHDSQTKNHWPASFASTRDFAAEKPGDGQATPGTDLSADMDAGLGAGTAAKPWRYVLLNDTNRLLSALHFGPALVCHTLRDGLAARGGMQMGWANTAQGYDALVAAQGQPDLLVLNGEGTLHHGSPRGRALLACCAAARDQGIPVALVNSVWQDNPPEDTALLKAFGVIHMRESLSAQAAGTGLPTRVTPDLAFGPLAPFYAKGSFEGEVQDLAIMDASRFALSEQLQDLSAHLHAPFFAMEARHVTRLRTRAAQHFHPGTSSPVFALPASLPQAQGWISGRFHGVVAALCAGVPVVALPSATHKIEGMLRDAGLLDVAVLPEDWLTLSSADQAQVARDLLARWTPAHHAAAASYVAQAGRAIEGMLDDVAGLAGLIRT